MATIPRLAPRLPRLIRSLHSSPPSTSLTSSLNVSEKLPDASTTSSVPPPGILDLNDTERLFASTPTPALARTLAVLYAIALDPLVDLGIQVMRSEAVMGSRVARAAVLGAVRASVYRHFCAGEDVEEAACTLRDLWGAGLRGILDYGLEDAEDSPACDRNLEWFLKTVEMTSSLPPSSVTFACVKITAICPISLLKRMSDLLRWEQKDASFHVPWKSHSLPILSDSSPLYHTPSMPQPLSECEEADLHSAQQRLSTLCHRCAQFNLPLLIDAEYTSVQPAIDYLTYYAAIQFNRDGQPMVYATIQAYLKDSKERLVQAAEAAEREGISMGFKLVRGAYLTRETHLAASLDATSPIHATIHETHACYNDCVSFMLERIVRGSGSVVLATHNLESGRVAIAKLEEIGIRKGDKRLQFAQLKGMAEGLSLGLRNAGFQVSKYLPFGPVHQVISYLLRRAEENRGLLSASTLDRQLIRTELKRRLKAAILGRG